MGRLGVYAFGLRTPIPTKIDREALANFSRSCDLAGSLLQEPKSRNWGIKAQEENKITEHEFQRT
jgi:hypothetical protein